MATIAIFRGKGWKIAVAATVTLLLALAASLLMLAAPGKPALAIVNGTTASAGEYPAMGYLQVSTTNGSFSCGGTLVDSRHFLTSASCAADATGAARSPGSFQVLLGDVNLDPPNDDLYGVSAVEVHANFDPATFHNDVAILTLDRSAAYEPMRVVGLGETTLWQPGDTATIIGWGTTSEGGQASNALLEANVPIRSDADCATAYAQQDGTNKFDPQTMVCAGAADPQNGSADTCQGDTGGPLLVPDETGQSFKLAGVTSWGEGCNQAGRPGVYARIGSDPLNSWVLERIDRDGDGVPDERDACPDQPANTANGCPPPPPLSSLQINDVRVGERTTTTRFTVRLSAPSQQTTTVNYATANGTAKAPADYATRRGTLTFLPGQITNTISVPIKGDTLNERDETFSVRLSGATNATIADSSGRGTIVDND